MTRKLTILTAPMVWATGRISWAALFHDRMARFLRAFLPNILLGLVCFGGADAGGIVDMLELPTSSLSAVLLLSSESASNL